jgi:hypothetical protein
MRRDPATVSGPCLRPQLLLISLALVVAGCGPDDSVALGEVSPLVAAGSPPNGAVQIADPYRARYPANTVADNYARSIWDMHVFEGRVFVGAGDYWNNRGPVGVWSIGDDGAVTDTRLEIVVDEEMVDRFIDADGTLYIPGKDATEGWDFGNFYFKQAGTWHKRRTIPNGLHVLDLAVFQGSLYVTMSDARRGAVLESTDFGESWHPLSRHHGVNGMLASTPTELLIFGNPLASYSAQGLREYHGTKLAPASAMGGPSRVTPFKGGVLYLAALLPMFDAPAPLLYLRRPDASYVALHTLAGETVTSVRDVRVEGGTAYVLAARRNAANSTAPFIGQVFATEDVITWRKVAEFTVPAPPYSLARLGGRFYIGLGNEGWFVTDTTLEPASGTIWRVE